VGRDLADRQVTIRSGLSSDDATSVVILNPALLAG